jgi:hypothetical protein
MKEIAVHEIGDGQVLAEDVACPETGQVLLAGGIELRRSHVELLERRGVLTVRILKPDGPDGPDEGGAGEDDADQSAGDSFADAMERLAHMFEGLDDDPIMRAIHAAARGMVETAMKGGDEG